MEQLATPEELAAFSQRFEFGDAIIRGVQLQGNTCQIRLECRVMHSGEWVRLTLLVDGLYAFRFSQPAPTAWNVISSQLTVLAEDKLFYLELGGLPDPRDMPQTCLLLHSSARAASSLM
ncbi:hypothetical protein [Deinococcus radiophilus]|uniref:hypothetical protein n=1 Tax=Deinococcus radiophilus TaxID=32062 RepID=UPI00361F4B2B